MPIDVETFSTPAHSTFAGGKHGARRVLVIDGHPIVRQGLRRVIEHQDDLAICGEADTGGQARIAIRESNPDAIIADIRLNQGDGIELVRDVRAHHAHLPILVLSSHDEMIYAERMLAVGANGYIMKHASSEEILRSLRQVLDGHIYVSEGVEFIRKSAPRGVMSTNPIDSLSSRELQILHLVGKGMSTREMAKTLHLSAKTIESHQQRIKHKLNLTTGLKLTHYAINWFTRHAGGN